MAIRWLYSLRLDCVDISEVFSRGAGWMDGWIEGWGWAALLKHWHELGTNQTFAFKTAFVAFSD